MTKQEAERIMLAYRWKNGYTGEEYGFRIIEYTGKRRGVHFFNCVESDNENPEPEDYREFAVFQDGYVLPPLY